MYIPLIIAIIMGLVGSSSTQSSPQPNGTVYISTDVSPNGLDDVPTDSIPGDGTGGETGSNPPR